MKINQTDVLKCQNLENSVFSAITSTLCQFINPYMYPLLTYYHPQYEAHLTSHTRTLSIPSAKRVPLISISGTEQCPAFNIERKRIPMARRLNNSICSRLPNKWFPLRKRRSYMGYRTFNWSHRVSDRIMSSIQQFKFNNFRVTVERRSLFGFLRRF